MDEQKSFSYRNDPLVPLLERHGIPVTRENYLAFAYPDNLPEEWTAELESMLPDELQWGYEQEQEDSHNPPSGWTNIVSADDDTAGSELLHWAGLGDIWNRNSLGDWFDPLKDVADLCHHVIIERERWDGGTPGRSGIWHWIHVDDPEALRSEMRTEIANLIRDNRDKVRQARRQG